MKSELRRFCWIGKNKAFNEFVVSPPITTLDILKGTYPSFFSSENRGTDGNCEFSLEVFEGDILIYYSKNGGMSSMMVSVKEGAFVGEGPFNTHPLEQYVNALDFEGIEIETQH